MVDLCIKSILGFGNALLDISVFIKDDSLLKKYNLRKDDQKEISDIGMNNLFNDTKGLEKHVSPGGCCSNSFRVLQWILNKKTSVFLFGTVGRDHEATILKYSLELEGLNTRFIEHETKATGKIVALISGPYRSLVAHIGAAEHFPISAISLNNEFATLFTLSQLVFIEAFFITKRAEAAKYVTDLCHSERKILVFNLCGEYIFEVVPEEILYIVKRADIIFGNRNEFEALKKLLKHETIEELVWELFTSAENKFQYKKVIVITNGPKPINCYCADGNNFQVQPTPINENEIVDTTGAGDAFVGGFLAGLVLSKEIDKCIKIGIYAAENIIKKVGCSLPQYEPKLM